ncbi:MAG: glycosyltransferase family 39 protein [bacterium]
MKINIKFILIVTILALVLRLAFNLYYGFNASPGIDGIVLDRIAHNLTTGHGYSNFPDVPTAKKPPAFILIISLIYKMFGPHNYIAVRIFLIILSSITPALVYLIAGNIFIGSVHEPSSRSIPKISALLTAISPLLIYNSWWFLSNTFMYFILALGVYLMLLPRDKLNLPVLLGSGLCLGITTLSIQYGTAFYLPLPFIWLYFSRPKYWLKRSAIITLGIMIPLSIWITRNYYVYESFIYNNTESGIRFWGGNNPKADGNWTPWIGSARFYFDSQKPGWGNSSNWIDLSDKMSTPFQDLVLNKKDILSEPEINEHYFSLGIKWIKDNPRDYLKLMGNKILIFWHPFSKHSVSPFLSGGFRKTSFLFELFILPFFIIGVIYSIKQWKNYTFLYILVVHQIFIGLYHFGDIQQRMRIGNYILIFSAIGIYFIKNCLHNFTKMQKNK